MRSKASCSVEYDMTGATGTPEGVGQIVPGDTVVLTIPEIGELTMGVTARS